MHARQLERTERPASAALIDVTATHRDAAAGATVVVRRVLKVQDLAQALVRQYVVHDDARTYILVDESRRKGDGDIASADNPDGRRLLLRLLKLGWRLPNVQL